MFNFKFDDEKHAKKLAGIIETFNNLPNKTEVFSGTLGVPVLFNPSQSYEINSKFAIKMVKPVQSVFHEDFKKIMGLFNSVELSITIWDMYNMDELLNFDEETIDLYNTLNDKDNFKKLFSKKKDSNNSKLIYKSHMKITKTKSACVCIDLFKYPSDDLIQFINDVLTTDRYTVICIYLKELLRFMTRMFKEKSKICRILQTNIVNNKAFKDKIPSKPSEMHDLYQHICNIVIDMYVNDLMYNTAFKDLEYEDRDKFDTYRSNPLTNMFNGDIKCDLKDVLPPEIIQKFNKSNLTVYDYATMIALSAKPLFGLSIDQFMLFLDHYDSSQDDHPELQITGMHIAGRDYLFPDGSNDPKEYDEENAVYADQAVDFTLSKFKGFGSTSILSALGVPIETEVDWTKRILNKIYNSYMEKSRKVISSWTTPNILTRHIANLPTQLHYDLDVTLYITVDSSGSMNDTDLQKINYLIRFFQEHDIPMIVLVHDGDCETDSDKIKIFDIDDIESLNKFIAYRYRSGGTSHRGVFKKIEELLNNPRDRKKAIVLVCSDLYSDISECWEDYTWPKKVETFFVTRTVDAQTPFGTVIYIS